MTPSLAARVLDVFFPRACAVCRNDVPAEGEFSLCDGCRAAVSRWEGFLCEVCGVPLPDGGARCHACRRGRVFRLCRSAGLYEGVLKDCLWRLKYEGKESLAAPLGRLLAESWASVPGWARVDAVTYVPLSFWREHRRGFNQARLLAEAFARETTVPLLIGILRKTRATRSQTLLHREERLDNVSGAFEVRDGAAVRGKSILLIDDVCTTGATLDACAAVLKKTGARRVDALTVARQA